ncbi:cytoskeletal protein RodZ [Salsuginibacillus halophilus]|uniref:Cytoskeletal protein RodZ n=1 Tax=Salsuginibacillus halophilus TaxID=517424 RepID=A0A2P8HYG9_9BACI|nr:RodZ domain-containing protein [Salsuginibacillus halophilus]PSL51253.1 cytoskeletal protein RodZ [Salsuginibacillus halophilus]
MAELGTFLKQHRENKQMTLEQLQERTKIQKRYLEAIEQDDYSALPGTFYARAFVKSYSEAVGLNPDDVFEQFGHELPQPKSQADQIPSRSERIKKSEVQRKKPKFAPFLSALAVLAAVLIIAVAIWVFNMNDGGDEAENMPVEDENGNEEFETNEGDESAEEDEEENAQEEGSDEEAAEADAEAENDEGSEDEAATEEDDEDEEEQEEAGLEEASVEGTHAEYYVTGSEEIEIELEFEGNSYVGFQDQNRSILEEASPGTEEAEQTYDFTDEGYVSMNIGHAPSLTVYVNGIEAAYAADTAQSDVQRITVMRE